MKAYAIILSILLTILPAYGQITGFFDDFEDGQLTGWQVDADHQRTFELAESNGILTIDYHRVADSQGWDNFNFIPSQEINVATNPVISLNIRSSVTTTLSVKPIYSNGSDGWFDQNLTGDNSWQTFTFPLSEDNYTNANLTRIYFYLDGGSTDIKSGTVNFDDFTIGESEFVLRVNNLVATTVDEETIELDWQCNDTTVVDHYKIYRDSAEGLTCHEDTFLDSVAVSHYTDTGLTENTTYFYKVIAVDTAGAESAPGSEASARTYDPNAGILVYTESVNATEIGRYEKFEINVAMENAHFDNPYNPEEIDLTAVFTSPSDSVWVIHGFYDNFNNRDQWKVRFSPNETGPWTYFLTATDKNGTGESEIYDFNVGASDHNGWIRQSTVNPHYFEYDDGTNYYGIGTYNPWNVNEGELNNLKAHGGNFVAYWNIMYDEGEIIESMNSGLGRYDQPKCGRIDQIIQWAEERDMKAMFAIWPHDLISNTVWAHQWHNNPYNTICSVDEFYSDAEAWEYQKKQYRYLIARWGYSRGLGIWEIVNEINGTDGWQNGFTAEAENWTRKVADYLRENDPYQRPNTASQSGGQWWPNGYQVVAVPNVHMYETQLMSPKYPSNPMRSSMYAYEYITQKFRQEFEKPSIFGEAGYTNSYGNYSPGSANYTAAYHNSIWVSWANGIAATPIWWDYKLLGDKDFDQLAAFAKFITNQMDYLDLAHKIYHPVEVSSLYTDTYIMARDTVAFGWSRQIDGMAISGKSFSINGLEDLTYSVDYYNTWTGDYLQSDLLIVEGGSAEIMVPAFPNDNPDVAFIIKPEEFGDTPHHLSLSTDTWQLLNDGESLAEITCLIKDEEGRFCGNATNEISFSIVGSGDFTSENTLSAIGGKAKIEYQSPLETGIVKIIAASSGLIADTIEIDITNQYNFDDFEHYNDDSELGNFWKVRGTSQVRLYLDKNMIYDGDHSLRMQYNIGNGAPPYATVYRPISKDLSQFNYLGFWYKPAGTNRQLVVRLTESDGTNRDYYFDLNDNTGKYVEIPLADFENADNDSINLGDVDEISLNVLKGNGNFGEGLLFFDNIKFLTTTMVSIDNSSLEKNSDRFQLKQNYPNPFNPETTIEFQIQQNSNVEIHIYDLQGNLMETLVNDFKSVGNYRVKWQAENYPSGIYMYKIVSGNVTEVRKCMLLK